MGTVLMLYHKVKEDHVVTCPLNGGTCEHVYVCQKCPRNEGFIENQHYKWVRCHPQ